MIYTLLLYFGLGAIAGSLGGLLGIGGGSIIVPILIYSFIAQGYDSDTLTQLAIGTSLASIALTSISAAIEHHSSRSVLWPAARRLAPGICCGAGAGGLFAATTSGPTLQIAFGVFLTAMAAQLTVGAMPPAKRGLPDTWGLLVSGGGIGFLSGIFGIGGGSLTVPFLSWCGVAVRQAIATSAALGVPIAVVGSLTYAYAGWHNPKLPADAFGFIYWPAVLGIALTSAPFARAGARLAHRIPQHVLKRLFSLYLFGVGMAFIVGNTLKLMR